MAVERIRCPKCSHEQPKAKECEQCGLIFSRYKRVQEKAEVKQAAQAAGRAQNKKRLWSVVQALLLVVLTAGGTYYFLESDSAVPLRQPAKSSQAAGQEQTGEATGQEQPREAAGPALPQPVRQAEAISGQAGPMTIDEARRATVSIETPWGSGSGFFVSDNYIVTNRHVVQRDEAEVAEFRRKVEKTRELVELEKKKINDLQARMQQTPKGPTRSQLQIIIEESRRGLDGILPQLVDAEKRLARMEENLRPTDIKIILADGSSHVASFLLISDKRDLALMALYVNDMKYLHRPPEKNQIQQGDKVFTIGSPVGLRNTVTAGVFSGYRQDPKDGSLFLQTDAPINPGNSGGPLIDEHGYVHGVNTMILQDTQGIGFAIPIETVFEEFGSSLY